MCWDARYGTGNCTSFVEGVRGSRVRELGTRHPVLSQKNKVLLLFLFSWYLVRTVRRTVPYLLYVMYNLCYAVAAFLVVNTVVYKSSQCVKKRAHPLLFLPALFFYSTDKQTQLFWHFKRPEEQRGT